MTATPIDNFFFDKLLRELHPSDALVYLVIWRQSYGAGTPTVKISTGDLAQYTGLSMTTVQTSVKALLKAKLLARQRESATVPGKAPLEEESHSPRCQEILEPGVPVPPTRSSRRDNHRRYFHSLTLFMEAFY